MAHSDLTLEALLRLLPDLEEVEGLRLSVIRAAVPDPQREWARSGAYVTIDKRLVAADRLESALQEAEAAVHDYTRALFEHYRGALRDFQQGNEAGAAYHLISLGERKEGAGLHRSARAYFETALSLSLPLTDKGPQILALRRIARVARSAGELREALLYYSRSAELARDAGDVRGEVTARTGIGYVLALQGRWAEAEASHREALARLDGAGADPSLRLERAQVYTNLGLFVTRQRRLEEAEEWFRLALDLWARLDAPVDLGVCFHCVAQLREEQGRREEGRDLYRQALALPVPPALTSGFSTDLAESYLRDGDVRQAERWARTAEEEAIAARSPYILGRVYQVRGNIARAVGEEDGFIFFEKALEIARERGLPLLEGETLIDYAALRQQMGEREEALSFLVRAREIFRSVGAAQEQLRAEEALLEAVPAPLDAPGD